jgi:hypothetical protein
VPADQTAVLYRERLTVPIAWWVLSALFTLSILLAFGFYLGPVWGFATALVSQAAATALFLSAAVTITVDEAWFSVGRASIELHYLGEIRALDAAEARRRRGPEADARAYLVLRPYIPTAVEAAVDDADDPAPYWLVASRHPKALTAALQRAVSAHAPLT